MAALPPSVPRPSLPLCHHSRASVERHIGRLLAAQRLPYEKTTPQAGGSTDACSCLDCSRGFVLRLTVLVPLGSAAKRCVVAQILTVGFSRRNRSANDIFSLFDTAGSREAVQQYERGPASFIAVVQQAPFLCSWSPHCAGPLPHQLGCKNTLQLQQLSKSLMRDCI